MCMRRTLRSWLTLETYGSILTLRFLDGGAERLVLRWKGLMQQLIVKNGGTHVGVKSTPEMEELLQRSGSSLYKPNQAKFKDLAGHEFKTLSEDLAPIQNDKPDTYREWNLFDEYIGSDTIDNIDLLKQPHILSSILDKWGHHKHLATAESDLPAKAREEKSALGDLAIRGITRLAKIIPVAPQEEWSGQELTEMVYFDADMAEDEFGKRVSSRLIAQALRGETWTLDYKDKEVEEIEEMERKVEKMKLNGTYLPYEETEEEKLATRELMRSIETRTANSIGLSYDEYKKMFPDGHDS